MKIGLPVAAYHPGNPAEYLAKALLELKHEVVLLDLPGFYQAYSQPDFDLFLGVDSSHPFDLRPEFSGSSDLSRLAFWCIDFRHNQARPERVPNDREMVSLISERGGAVFQAQEQDFLECRKRGIERCAWIPLGADPAVWNDQPSETKQFDLGFVGNVYDQKRAEVLQSLMGDGRVRFAFGGPHQGKQGLWKEHAARFLRMCRVGFNINSFFGEPYDYDVNMRVFETLSCGIPLVTNEVPSLARIFPKQCEFIRCYKNEQSVGDVVAATLKDEEFLDSGASAREYILTHATYRHRAEAMLDYLRGEEL